MMYICKIRSAPPSSPPSPPSAPVATPARACPSGSAPPVSMMDNHDENHKGNRNHQKTNADLAEMVDNARSNGISQNIDFCPEPERNIKLLNIKFLCVCLRI